MYTLESFLRLSENPNLMHVNVVHGRVWLSEAALDDIEQFTGRTLDSENPREVLEFFRRECALLQQGQLGPSVVAFNFNGFCNLRLLEHALETQLHGQEHAGPVLSYQELHDAFHATERDASVAVLH